MTISYYVIVVPIYKNIGLILPFDNRITRNPFGSADFRASPRAEPLCLPAQFYIARCDKTALSAPNERCSLQFFVHIEKVNAILYSHSMRTVNCGRHAPESTESCRAYVDKDAEFGKKSPAN